MISQLAIFEPQHCDCQRCRSPCVHGPPGEVAPGDIDRIAWHIGLEDPTDEFVQRMFRACSDGPRGPTQDFPDGETPVLRPATKPDGTCVFLSADQQRCTVYPVRPFGCSRVNQCDAASSAAALKGLANVIATSPHYVCLWWEVWKAQHSRETTHEQAEAAPPPPDSASQGGGD